MALIAEAAERPAAWEALNGQPAPIDALGSRLDPRISQETVVAQADRIAAARGADATAVRALIDGTILDGTLGLFGEPRVNVLETDLAPDAAFPWASREYQRNDTRRRHSPLTRRPVDTGDA